MSRICSVTEHLFVDGEEHIFMEAITTLTQ